MEKRVKLSTQKVRRERKARRIIIVTLLLILLLLILLYFAIGIIYNNGNFSITLDKNLYFDKGLIIYDDPEYKVYRSELLAPSPNMFDNISYKWLPEDMDQQNGGSHNGKNYLAYTFFVENTGDSVSDYWNEVIIDDVIRNVDSAIRIRVYRNGQPTTYATLAANGEAEPNTTPFVSESVVARSYIDNFKPGDIDRYTIALWIEGSDPECTDNILGGEFKVRMDFNSGHTKLKEKRGKENEKKK